MTNATMVQEDLKRCNTCGETKPRTEFHIQRVQPRPGHEDEPTRYKIRPNCKICQREYMRNRRLSIIAKQGTEFLESETQRVRDYYEYDPARIEKRQAGDRARYTANLELRRRHPQEYAELLEAAKREEGVPDDDPE